MTTPADALDPWDGGETFTATRGALWELLAETAEGAPHMIYGAECLACPETCRMDNNPRPVQAWAIAHTHAHPTHRQYLLTSQKHGRVTPVLHDHHTPRPTARRPEAPAAPPGEPPDPYPSGALRSLLRPAARVLAAVGRYAGLLFVVGLSTACGLVIGTALSTATG